MDFTQHFVTRLKQLVTPQSEPIPDSDQVRNSAGGYVWEVSRWDRLDRFLVLGSEGGTYYTGERELTRQNAQAVIACIHEDGRRVVAQAVAVSVAGRAPKNDPALFVLALAASVGDDATRAAAFDALPAVARTGTHLMHWMQSVNALRGWGRGVRRAVASWYTDHQPRELAYQVLKYRRRDGWSHRDALRLAHPKAPTLSHDMIFRYATRGWESLLALEGVADLEVCRLIEAVETLRFQTPDRAAQVIAEHRLTREMVPTELLRHAEVWEALLQEMPLTAMIRNLGAMGSVGLLAPLSTTAVTVASRLRDQAMLRRARVHPVALLSAMTTYASGRGVRGKLRWQPVAQVVDALDAAFYLAFENAPSTGKRVMLALDVSGSMSAPVVGLQGLNCREGSAAMALVTAAREPNHMFTAFAAERWSLGFGTSAMRVLSISPRQRLDDVVKAVKDLMFGPTDCALPMLKALKNRWPVDLFVVYTDSETWAGWMHPVQALRKYRDRMGIPARLVVVGMASNGFTIADPDDAGMLDVVGFDTTTPQVIADFAA
jgi:60 kDa SS-A/Ro ribonucleoprotein